jgi:hypothetical protein
MPIIPALGRLRRNEFEAIPDYIVKPCLKKPKPGLGVWLK